MLFNAGYMFFYVVSDFIGEFANLVYKDWFSFFYWLGDLVYRVVVFQGPY